MKGREEKRLSAITRQRMEKVRTAEKETESKRRSYRGTQNERQFFALAVSCRISTMAMAAANPEIFCVFG